MREVLSAQRRGRLQRIAAPLVLTMLLVGAVLAPGAHATDPVLEILEEALTLAADEAKIVTLQNQYSALTGLTFEAVLVDEKGQPFERVLTLNAEPLAAQPGCEGDKPCIDGLSVAQFTIKVRDEDVPDITGALSGYLHVGTAEEVVTEVVSLSLTPKKEDDGAKAFGFWRLDFAAVVWAALGAGFLAFLVCFGALFAKYPGPDWKDLWGGHLNPIEWDFSKNWASTVTGLGGIAGTIVGLTILPETTKLLAKTEKINEFTILAAMFGLGVALAPLIGGMLTTLFPKKGQPGAARVWVYVLAASLIVWAAMGQTLVGLIFLDEVRQGATSYKAVMIVLEGLLFLLGVAVFVYAVKKTVSTVLTLIRKQKQPGAVRLLKEHVVSTGNSIDQHNYAAAVDKLRDEVKPLRWTLDSLEGTPRDEEQFKRVTVADICDLMLDKLDAYAGPDQVVQAKLLLSSVASRVDALREALKNQVQKPQGVPAAIDALYAEVAEVEKTLMLPKQAWDVQAAMNRLATLQTTLAADVKPVQIPAEPIYLP